MLALCPNEAKYSSHACTGGRVNRGGSCNSPKKGNGPVARGDCGTHESPEGGGGYLDGYQSATADIEELRREAAEVHRLRAEITQLHREKVESKALQARIDKLALDLNQRSDSIDIFGDFDPPASPLVLQASSLAQSSRKRLCGGPLPCRRGRSRIGLCWQ